MECNFFTVLIADVQQGEAYPAQGRGRKRLGTGEYLQQTNKRKDKLLIKKEEKPCLSLLVMN